MSPKRLPPPKLDDILSKVAANDLSRAQLKKGFAWVDGGYGLKEQLRSEMAPIRKHRKKAHTRFAALVSSIEAFCEVLGPERGQRVALASEAILQQGRKVLEQLDVSYEQEVAARVVARPLGAQNLADLCIRLQDRHGLESKELAVLASEFHPAKWERRYSGVPYADAVDDYSDYLRQEMSKFRKKCRRARHPKGGQTTPKRTTTSARRKPVAHTRRRA